MLYDVGCQTHRSLAKWHYLPKWKGRIIFGVSVFHAYGHQWSCQLWYHPRKSGKWGLRDGEGCERFWNELLRLVPGLRVTGFFRRLYIIDMQIEHIRRAKYPQLGAALHRRLVITHKRLVEAEAKLAPTGFSIPYLLDQFKQQRRYQSRPISRQSKMQGLKAVQDIIDIEATLGTLEISLQSLHQELTALASSPDSNTHRQAEVNGRIKAQSASVSKLTKELHRKTADVMKDQPASKSLLDLKTNQWLTAKLNMRIVKDQVISKLQSHKRPLVALDKQLHVHEMGEFSYQNLCGEAVLTLVQQ